MFTRQIPSVWIACIVLLFAMGRIWGADWPQYRGLNHDGSSAESIRTNWSQKPPTVIWKKTISTAWSSITISGGRAFTQGNRRLLNVPSEFCIALNADTGAELWATLVDEAYYPDGGTGSTDGPRSTPTVDGDFVYVFTSRLRLFCLRATDGTVVWSRDFINEFSGTSVIPWQNSASPLIVGDLIYLNSNVANQTLMALRKSDGVIMWKGQTDTMTHATPVYATIAGTPQVIFQTLKGLVGVTPTTGSVLWRYNFTPSSTSTASSPIVADDYVYASCAYAKGAWTAKITKSGTTFTAAQANYTGANSAYQNHWATPVHHAGYLYGIVEKSSHSLACFSLVGRTNRWITSTVGSGSPGYASVIKVGGKLVVLSESGELVLVDPNATAYTEIGRFQALTGTSWNHPVFSNGRIYARSNSQMVALDVGVPVVPLPAVKANVSIVPAQNKFTFEVAAQNGTALDGISKDRIEIVASTNLAADISKWLQVPSTFTLTNGKYRTELLLNPLFTNQFFRVRGSTNSP